MAKFLGRVRCTTIPPHAPSQVSRTQSDPSALEQTFRTLGLEGRVPSAVHADELFGRLTRAGAGL